VATAGDLEVDGQVVGEAFLNELGADGWELVGTTETVRGGNTHNVYLWLKRPRSATATG